MLRLLGFSISCLLCFKVCGQAAFTPPPDERFKTDLLVVVAHPDDESAIGAYLARAAFDEHRRVAVVFGTRGGTGGNGQGQEQSEALQDIREIEGRRALAHFEVSNVFFLRGLDTAGQSVLRSLENWNHGDQLGRLVRIVRLTRPTVIATWLPAVVAGEDHGDHQAAGVLATEAFDLAGNPTAFAEQVAAPRDAGDLNNLTEGLHPWQPQKLYFFSDASNTDFLKGKGPVYSAQDVSGSRKVTYARLAAEECSEHLTQSDSGQFASAALHGGPLGYLAEPVQFAFGKSLVESPVTADLFEGVRPQGIVYHAPPGFTWQAPEQVSLELGGPWLFYKSFVRAHGLEDVAHPAEPEMLVNFESPLTVPLVIENPSDGDLEVSFKVKTPAGWVFWHRLPSQVTVKAHGEAAVSFEVRSPVKPEGSPEGAKGTKWGEIRVEASDGRGTALGSVRLRVGVDGGAMPQ